MKGLIESCSKFEQTEIVEVSEKVRKILVLYKCLRAVPEVRAHHNMLQSCWENFEKDVRKLVANLELALKFHQIMFEVSISVVMGSVCVWTRGGGGCWCRVGWCV